MVIWTGLTSTMLDAQSTHFVQRSSDIGIADVANITDLYGNGASASDYDGDGDIDFYLCTDINIHDRLYKNDGKGKFEEVAQQSGILETGSSRSALWFDYDGDGLLDLVVVGERCVNLICDDPITLALYRQNLDHTFSNKTMESGLKLGFPPLDFYAVGGLCAGDLNQDNYLDLVITVWGGDMVVFYNNKNGTFRNATLETNIVSEQKNYWQAMIHDFNDDGLLDVYANVDFAANELWINKNGKFVNQAMYYGLDHAFNEMGMAIGDTDNDGDLDIYMTNITRTYLGSEQHNILYQKIKSDGDIYYREIAQNVGVHKSGWDWGATFTDINNDGYQDIATTNGWNDAFWSSDRSHLWINSLAGFVDYSDQCKFNDGYSGTTLLSFDMDRDGDLDLLQTLKDQPSSDQPAIMYENTLESIDNSNNYIVIKPRMKGTNHFAIGSVVTVVNGDKASSRLISAGTSFYGQEPAEAFYGIGKLTNVEEVRIKWPTNEVSVFTDLGYNKVVTLDYENSKFITSAPNEEELRASLSVNVENAVKFEIRFLFSSINSGLLHASLFNLNGQLLAEDTYSKTDNSQEFNLKGYFPQGMCVLRVQFGEKYFIKKVVIN